MTPTPTEHTWPRPRLVARLRELEAALHALVERQPIHDREWGSWECTYCDGDDLTVDAPDHVTITSHHGRKYVGHEPDCPWVRARAVLAGEKGGP